MKESNVGGLDEKLIYEGVRLGGQPSWDDNKKERQAGASRIIPEPYLHPSDPNVKWPDYQQTLQNKGVKDPAFDRSPNYCHYGDSTILP